MMPSKRKLKNKIEDLEGGGEDVEDLEIVIGSGPEKWAITIDTSETSKG